MSVSAYTLVAICVFRCIAIASPLHSSVTLTKRHSGTANLIVWLAMIVINIPAAIFYTEQRKNYCHFVYRFEYQKYIFNTITIGIDFLLPMMLFCGGTMFIIRTLCKRNKAICKINGTQRGATETEHSRRNTRKLMVLVVSVAVVYFLSWLPFQLIALVNTIQTHGTIDDCSSYVISTVAQLLAFANSCFNPIIYNFASAGFRRAFVKALKCCPILRLRRTSTGETRSTNLGMGDIPMGDRQSRKRLITS
ncbi:somatostatin receptor type 4-like [Lingula anatina]|uniref:Somatostatin receptor type 4-like n=1 Tax=Lingula anatina TaxID=7574 RepID=A0A1S3JFC6_LINAN|nr:somatostatin receptor type 4-like [Lingula anatina]|eukprot:XP_013409043.1 somatostatin receptor type 4-like [Lingula anatina]